MERKWSIRAYREGDEGKIFELSKSVNPEAGYNSEQWMRWWHWKYRSNPAGGFIIWLAEVDGRIVSQYAVNGVKMKVGNEIITAAQSVDTMTHPDYRGHGIFFELSTRVFDEAGRQGIDIVYGLPNKMTSWHKKYWFEVGAQRILIRPLNIENILKKYIAQKYLLKACTVCLNLIFKAFFRIDNMLGVDGLTITRISSFDERINGLWEKASNNYEIMIIRDKEYLNWRYVDVPDANYAIYLAEKEGQILGYTVLKCENRQGLVFGRIFDLIVPSGQEQIAQSLILKATEFFKGEKADLVIYRLIAGKTRYETVRRSGFICPSFIRNKLRFVARPNTPKISETFLRNRAHWFIQTGDLDTI